MNTPDTEWREGLRKLFQMEEMPTLEAFIEELLTSRDTYWEERVEEAHERGYKQAVMECELDLPFTRTQEFKKAVEEIGTENTPITHEDNLK